MLEYKGCLLRPIEKRDLELILQWRNLERIRSVMFTDRIITMDEHLRWYGNFEHNKAESQHFIFEYYGAPLGQVNITMIDERNKRCYWGFYIGEDHAPHGSGMAMGYMVLQYIFETRGMHKLCSEAISDNSASIKYQKKLGFVEEGYFKEHILKKERYHDIVCLALLSKDWRNNKRKLRSCCFSEENNE